MRRSVAAAYLEGLAEGGHDPSVARLAGDVDIIVADDPEAAWPRIAPHYLHQLNSYNAGAGRPLHQLQDLGDRRGEGRVRVAVHLTVLTVDEAIADVRTARRRPARGARVHVVHRGRDARRPRRPSP